MKKSLFFLLLLGLACGGLMGCTDDENGKSDAVLDGGTGDGGGSDGSGNDDAQVIPDGSQPDQVFGNVNCSEILTCVVSCTTDDCLTNCEKSGTAAAQQNWSNLILCMRNARTIQCQSQCVVESSPACYDCVDQACAKEKHYCRFGTVELSGFGNYCDLQGEIGTQCLQASSCVELIAGDNVGFCTIECNGEELCQGAPLGTFAQCLFPAESGRRCAFICKTKDEEFTCPDKMVCSTTETSAGSGIYLCTEASP